MLHMTRPGFLLRRFLASPLVDRLTAEKLADKRTIDGLANRLQAESWRNREIAAVQLARIERLSAELATIEWAYDEIGDRLVRAEAKLARRDAWIQRAVACMKTPYRPLRQEDERYLIDTAPTVGDETADEIADRLVRAEAKLAGRDAWIRRAEKAIRFIVFQEVLPTDDVLEDLLDTAPLDDNPEAQA